MFVFVFVFVFGVRSRLVLVWVLRVFLNAKPGSCFRGGRLRLRFLIAMGECECACKGFNVQCATCQYTHSQPTGRYEERGR